MPKNILEVKNLRVSVQKKDILKNLDLALEEGKVNVIMGPNGSGKSTLASVLMGHPSYDVEEGTILFAGEDLLTKDPTERALSGIFLSFQYPSEVSGVTISSYLRMVYNKRHSEKLSPVKFRKYIKEKLDLLEINESVLDRYLNDGFSGGEKKRMEILQMLVLEPKLAILDETDSGLDIDAIKIVSKAVQTLKEQTKMSVLLITHYTRILKYITPDKVFILQDGKIVKEGGKDLANELEEQGYAPFGDSEDSSL